MNLVITTTVNVVPKSSSTLVQVVIAMYSSATGIIKSTTNTDTTAMSLVFTAVPSYLPTYQLLVITFERTIIFLFITVKIFISHRCSFVLTNMNSGDSDTFSAVT